jgi:hypothetical protein
MRLQVALTEFGRAPARQFDGAARSFPTPAGVRVRGTAINAGYSQAIETINESARIKF